MQGNIFQILVLVTHGNMVLSGQPVADFFPKHDAFKFDEFVRFVDLERVGNKWSEKPFANDPNGWLTTLKSKRCSGLKVERIPTDKKGFSDRMSVGFVGGGGRWIIETVCPDGSDYWEAKWEKSGVAQLHRPLRPARQSRHAVPTPAAYRQVR